MSDDRPDHGAFTLGLPQEGVMLVQLVENARKNKEKPGHAWGRFQAERKSDGLKGFKVFHVDLSRNVVTITEEWGGRETARKTVSLTEPSAPEPSGPPEPPDPGPEEPTFHRLSFRAADPWPDDDLREWAMTRADDDVGGLSALPRRIRLCGNGFQEILNLPLPLAPDVAPGTGATLAALAARPGVERRFAEGWLAGIEGRGTAWILEACADGGWWLALRTFERRPGMLGVWTSAWSSRAGRNVAELPAPLRPVLAPPPGEAAIDPGVPLPAEPPEIGMFGGTLRAGEAVPETAEGVAERVGRDWEAKLPLGEAPSGVRVTVFRGREWETWELEGEFPMGVDDLVRAIAARGEPPTSLAVVRMGVVPVGQDRYRALVTAGEAGGVRHTRALCLRLAPDGGVLGYRLVNRRQPDIGDDGWLGVPPITEMTLFPMDAGEA